MQSESSSAIAASASTAPVSATTSSAAAAAAASVSGSASGSVVAGDGNSISGDGNNAGTAAALASDPGLLALEHALLNTCETLASMASIVVDFSYDSQDVLYGKVNEFVKDLSEIDAKAQEVSQSIPLDVLEAIDKGRNPDQSTHQMMYVFLY